MYYLGARYYVPTLMRFINPDNTAVFDVQDDLYDKNLYAYCDNNPVVRYDISGCFWKELFTAGITIAAAGIAAVAFAPAIACAVIAVVGGSAASATVLGTSVAVAGDAAFISGAAMAGGVAILNAKTGGKKPTDLGKDGERQAGINPEEKQKIEVNN